MSANYYSHNVEHSTRRGYYSCRTFRSPQYTRRHIDQYNAQKSSSHNGDGHQYSFGCSIRSPILDRRKILRNLLSLRSSQDVPLPLVLTIHMLTCTRFARAERRGPAQLSVAHVRVRSMGSRGLGAQLLVDADNVRPVHSGTHDWSRSPCTGYV